MKILGLFKNNVKFIGYWVGLIGGIAGIFSVMFSVWWSIYTYNIYLPLEQANVIFLESVNVTRSKSDNVMQSGDMMTSFDQINPVIKNIGKATAENIIFKIYAIYFDESLKFPNSNDSIENFFNDHLIHDLPADTVANFGSINLPLAAESCKRILPNEKQQIALIYHLQFTDSITRNVYNRFFIFQYGIGTDKFQSLIGADYQKIRDRIIKKLELDKSDDLLLNFIKNKK